MFLVGGGLTARGSPGENRCMDSQWLKTTTERAELDRQRLADARRRLQEAEAEVAKLVERVRSWDVILGTVTEPVSATAAHEEPRDPTIVSADEWLPIEDRQSGLRDAIRSALRGVSGRGLRPKEVTRLLIKQGYKNTGASDLGTRVSNEMWRMTKRKMLKKEAGLYYAP
jgi:hypothetical protein